MRPLALGTALLVLAAAAGAVSAASIASASVMVAPARVDSELAPIADGLAEWLRQRIRSGGLRVADGRPVRVATPAGAERLSSTADLLSIASRTGQSHALFADLRYRRGQVELTLRLYAVASAEMLTAAQGAGAVEELDRVAEEAASQILKYLGSTGPSGPALPRLQLENLAACGRALEWLDRGRLMRAWEEVDSKISPTAISIREKILEAADRPDAPVEERARLLAARGESIKAWRLIGRNAVSLLEAQRPDLQRLVAAGEIQLERGNTRQARAFFEKAARVDPHRYDVQLGLGRVLAMQNEKRAAARAFERAAKLETRSPQALEHLAELHRAQPALRADDLLRAGERASSQLSPHRAIRHFDRAVELKPVLMAEALAEKGALQERLGQPTEALHSFRRSLQAQPKNAEAWRGVAHAQRTLGDMQGSEASYRKALEVEPDDSDSLRDLGELYRETGRNKEALRHLERAVKLAPRDREAQSQLALTLQSVGDHRRALEILQQGEFVGSYAARDLLAAARILREQGHTEAAQRRLLEALEIEPASGELRRELADLYEERGDLEAAARERELAQRLVGLSSREVSQAIAMAQSAQTRADSFDHLVENFATDPERDDARRVALLGLREPRDPKSLALTWLHPRAPALRRIHAELLGAIDARFTLVGMPKLGSHLTPGIRELFDFDNQTSLNPNHIVEVNRALGTDAVFLARVSHAIEAEGASESLPTSCRLGPHLQVQMRMLNGAFPDTVTILSSDACIPGGLGGYETWNVRAAGAYAAFLLFVLFPILRGWGRVVVTIKIPPETRALFSARISRRSLKIKGKKVRKDEKAQWRFEDRLRSLARRERRLRGTSTTFRRVPARRRAYYVTVRGPLRDFVSGDLIGDFMEEQTLRVRRGQVNVAEFDLRPKDCAVEVTVQRGQQPVTQARIGLRGDPQSLRYASQTGAFLYLKPGKYVIMAGADGAVAEREIEIDSLEPRPLLLDLEDPYFQVFSGCPEAVDSYLESDFGMAAKLLDLAGKEDVARVVRARWHAERGDMAAAGGEFEAAGRLADAAAAKASTSDFQGSAELFEKAGDFARAGESYRQAGDIASAARCYDEAHEYDHAIECYREVGDLDKLSAMLAKIGDYFEAGKAAAEAQLWDRAIDALQQVDRRDDSYGEACQLLAHILTEQGQLDLAAERYDEALQVLGVERAPLEMQEHYAKLLEGAGKLEDALVIYEGIRRRDLRYGDVNERIKSLRQRLETARGHTATPGGRPAAPTESRYEILEEAGRGGMGVVYKARDKQLGRIVALKRLPENLREHPTAVKFFLREARSAAALNHPNIVTLFDAGQENDTYFITMEYLEGSPLSTIVRKRGRLKARHVARVGFQIAAGLQYAHQKRIIHRDIKTSNLFFTQDKIVKIMDFGLAKMLEEVRKASTTIAGTPYYMAPEQATGEAVDHRSDLYAFGVTLFRLATGSLPFEKGDVTHHHRHTPPPDPRERMADIPEPLAVLILQLMAKRPDERPADAAEVGTRLQALVDASQS